MGFIVNTNTRKKGSGHWVAIFLDADNDRSIEYYDSFAEDIPKNMLVGLKKVIDKWATFATCYFHTDRWLELFTEAGFQGDFDWFHPSDIIN